VGAALLLGLLGGWLGMTLAGTVHHEVGPLTTDVQILPVWGGGTTVDIPPLGQLVLDSHGGPLGVEATLVGVDVEEARELFGRPDRLADLRNGAEHDLRWALKMAALQSAGAALAGAALLSLLALRRVRMALVGMAGAAVALTVSGAMAVATVNATALAEPRYTGLLTSAPAVVGNADQIVNDFTRYGDQLGKIVENVTGLYAVGANLPVLPPEQDTLRVLHVSDMHLAPHAWNVVRTVARNYRVDVIVDSGDITDHGSKPENRYLEPIRSLPAPYVWVRGNHDSMATEQAMRKIPNAVVLDGQVRRVKGLTFLGAGDPTFTPDKSAMIGEEAMADRVAGVADGLAGTAARDGGVDVMVYHDSQVTGVFDGVAKLSLSGHLHYRKVRQGEKGTWLMQQGSTGGSGLRALEPKEPARIQLSVLHLDRSTGDLLAYDDITLGGLGLASAEINRQVVTGDESSTELVAPAPDASSEEARDPDDDGWDEVEPAQEPSDEPGDEPTE
jgi:predicted MPP superfamily phosphohydrolase